MKKKARKERIGNRWHVIGASHVHSMNYSNKLKYIKNSC